MFPPLQDKPFPPREPRGSQSNVPADPLTGADSTTRPQYCFRGIRHDRMIQTSMCCELMTLRAVAWMEDLVKRCYPGPAFDARERLHRQRVVAEPVRPPRNEATRTYLRVNKVSSTSCAGILGSRSGGTAKAPNGGRSRSAWPKSG